MASTEHGRRLRVNYAAGAWFGVASAALFGASAPLAKRLLPHLPPVLLAGLLYCGAALALTVARLLRVATSPHKPLERRDCWTLSGVVFFGGLCGPVLLMIGLSRVSAVVGSLLLNLEGVCTAVLAVAFFGERLSARESAAIALVLVAAAVVTYHPGAFDATWIGVMAVAAATACWGLDNNLMQRLSTTDPVRLVQIKSAVAGPVNVVLALALLQVRIHEWRPVAWSLVLGTFSYGVSIVLDVYALRYLGAAREAAFFATAPIVGAVLAVPVLGETLRAIDVIAGMLMMTGVMILVRQRD
jgi:drug/metabolite transporter (DMT)-like permease